MPESDNFQIYKKKITQAHSLQWIMAFANRGLHIPDIIFKGTLTKQLTIYTVNFQLLICIINFFLLTVKDCQFS